MGHLILDGALPGTVNICTKLISFFDKLFTLPSFHSLFTVALFGKYFYYSKCIVYYFFFSPSYVKLVSNNYLKLLFFLMLFAENGDHGGE